MHMMSCSHCGDKMEMDKMEEHMRMMHPDKKAHSDTMSPDTEMTDENMGEQKAGEDEAE